MFGFGFEFGLGFDFEWLHEKMIYMVGFLLVLGELGQGFKRGRLVILLCCGLGLDWFCL